ncbi:MAG: peptide ABC transporter substrate-binding protein, partial [Sulfurovum sp.]|nr:peptide ABC transporter substrate-binding protein [Sulfurovum sp.]
MCRIFIKIFLLLLITIQAYSDIWNNPHNSEKIKSDTLFTSFSIPLKRLDPVVSYSANEWAVIGQIYEPPLQYNYLKRPYELEPLTLTQMPIIRYLDKDNHEVDEDSSDLVYSEYRLELREDIQYQDHPAFVKKADGELLYGELSENELEKIDSLDDLK